MKDRDDNIMAAFVTGVFTLAAAVVGGVFLLVQSGFLGGEVTLAQPTATPDPRVLATLTAEVEYAFTVATSTAIDLAYERAKGNINLQDWDAALVDLELVFNAQPNYKDVQILLAEVRGQLSVEELTKIATLPCKFAAETDGETFINLIRREEEIALNAESSQLSEIYLPNAFIRDAKKGIKWNSVRERYAVLFESEAFLSLNHFDFEVVGNTGSVAWMTNSTIGEVQIKATGERIKFESDPSADHWTFEKGEAGCWKIASLEFNAAGEIFP